MPSSLTRFLSRALVSSTIPPVSVCDTVAYGLTRSFSCRQSVNQSTLAEAAASRHLSGCVAGFAWQHPYGLEPSLPIDGRSSFPSTPSCLCRPSAVQEYSTCFPSPTPDWPGLRGRLTLGGRTFPRKSWEYGGRDSRPAVRYSCPHNHLNALHARSPERFDAHSTLLYHSARPRPGEIRNFGSRFSPDHFRRTIARLVSCYALFKWWLPLSQHPSCFSDRTSLVTEPALGTLIGGLGCFHFDYEAYPPQSISTRDCRGIRSLIGVGNPVRPLVHPVLYLRGVHSHRLTLKLFRGEPAITEFDKSFAPTHRSS